MKIFWLSLLLPYFLARMLHAEPSWQTQSGDFAASITVSPQTLTIDQQVQVELALTYPQDYYPDEDTIRANLARQDNFGESPYQIVGEKTNLPKRSQNGPVKGFMVFTLEPQIPGNFDLTFYNIPFLPAKKDGKIVQLISGFVKVAVNMPPTKPFKGVIAPLMTLSPRLPIDIDPSNRMKYIQNPEVDEKAAKRNAEFLKAHTFPWIEVLICIAFIGGIIWLLRAQKEDAARRKKAAREKDVKTKALETLELLEKQDFTKLKQFDPAYVQMTNTVRLFIESRYHIKAATMTTEEFLYKMKEHPVFDVSTRMMLSQFLVSSDKVKFAHHTPSADEFRQAVQDAHKFIEAQK